MWKVIKKKKSENCSPLAFLLKWLDQAHEKHTKFQTTMKNFTLPRGWWRKKLNTEHTEYFTFSPLQQLTTAVPQILMISKDWDQPTVEPKAHGTIVYVHPSHLPLNGKLWPCANSLISRPGHYCKPLWCFSRMETVMQQFMHLWWMETKVK